MAEESAVREQAPEVSRAGVAAGPTSLGDNLESLGQGIKAAWQSATAAVTEAEVDAKERLETTVGAMGGQLERRPTPWGGPSTSRRTCAGTPGF
jgi:hypothetical protein